jgi:NhaA family Na+:H+ antiporter
MPVLTRIFRDFFYSESVSGILLIISTLISLVLANSAFGDSYMHFWETTVAHHSLSHWINDGLMAVFFLLVGLELERELYIGELADIKNALLPIFAAIGGMLVPAGMHLFLNWGMPTQAGAGIPMATDIAFSLGILALFGSRVPASLKIFLTALAIADDLGAILVIAIFYTNDLSWINLGIALAIYAVLVVMGRKKVYVLFPYLIGGVAMWYFMLNSGVHATITGVLLAFAIPFGKGDDQSLSYRLQHFLHKPVSFLILPVFALANTGIRLSYDWYANLLDANSMGIMLGLVAGKPIGILLFSFLAVVLRFSSLPNDLQWRHLTGAGFLAGIGFTMSIFVSILAFDDPNMSNVSQIAVLVGSLLSGLLGAGWFLLFVKKIPAQVP